MNIRWQVVDRAQDTISSRECADRGRNRPATRDVDRLLHQLPEHAIEERRASAQARRAIGVRGGTGRRQPSEAGRAANAAEIRAMLTNASSRR